MKSNLVVFTLVAMIVAGPLFAQSSAPAPMPSGGPTNAPMNAPMNAPIGHGPGQMLKAITSQLNLTQDQQERLKSIYKAAKDWMKQHRAQHVDQLSAFVEEFKKDHLDEATLDQLAQVTEKEREDARVFMRQTLVQVHRVLTPEQRAQAAEKIGQLANRWLNMEPNAKSVPESRGAN